MRKILAKVPVFSSFLAFISFCVGSMINVSNYQGKLRPDGYLIDSDWIVFLFIAIIPIIGLIVAIAGIMWEEKNSE